MTLHAQMIWGCGSLWAVLLTSDARMFGYAAVPAAFLPFALGALMFHLKNIRMADLWNSKNLANLSILSIRPVWVLLLCFLSIVMLSAVRVIVTLVLDLPRVGMMVHLLNMVPGALLLYVCLRLEYRIHFIAKFDDILGQMSYPIYVSHWLIFLLISKSLTYFDVYAIDRGMIMLFVCSPPLIFFSWLCNRLIDQPVSDLRDRVRAA